MSDTAALSGISQAQDRHLLGFLANTHFRKKSGDLTLSMGVTVRRQFHSDGLELNATTVLDALDEGRSEITRFDDGGILNIDRCVFRPEAIGNCLLSLFHASSGYAARR
jgi:hypothetical protein